MNNKTKDHIIIADTSPLIALAIMDLLPVLNKLFKQVIVPEAVVQECLANLSKPQSATIQKALNDNILQQEKVANTEYCQLLGQLLDAGEAEAITLAKELKALALIDEKAGRKIAAREGIQCVGSLYILIKAKQQHFILTVMPLMMRLLEHGYFLSPKLMETVLIAANEMNESNRRKLMSKINLGAPLRAP